MKTPPKLPTWGLRPLTPLILALSVSAGCEPEPTQMDPDVHRSEIQAWQASRLAALREPDGWLSVVGLYWLEPGENSFGTDSSNAIVFPSLPGVPPRIGSLFLEDGVVRMEVAGAVAVTVENEPVTRVVLYRQENGQPRRARLGSLSWQVLQRQNLIGIRVRDSENPAIQEFEGIDMFPVDLAWRVPARFERYDPPRIIEVPNILGQITQQPSPGAVVFRVNGERHRLDVTGEPGAESFFLVFGDETNGLESYGGGRFLTVPAPDENGRLFVDFNQAYNPPCVFTEFATCPLPPPQNKLPVRIEAGEMSGH